MHVRCTSRVASLTLRAIFTDFYSLGLCMVRTPVLCQPFPIYTPNRYSKAYCCSLWSGPHALLTWEGANVIPRTLQMKYSNASVHAIHNGHLFNAFRKFFWETTPASWLSQCPHRVGTNPPSHSHDADNHRIAKPVFVLYQRKLMLCVIKASMRGRNGCAKKN